MPDHVRDLLAQIDALQAELARVVGSGVDAVISDRDGGVWLTPSAADALNAQRSASARDAAFRSSVIDSLPANVAVLDERGVIVAVNARWMAFAHANGGDPAAYVGASYFGSAPADPPAELQALDGDGARRVLEGVRDVVEGRRERFDEQYPCHSPSTHRWFRMEATTIAGGGAVVTHFDVTDLVEKRLELERAQRRHRAVFDAVTDALCVVDARGVVVDVNPTAAKLLGPAPSPVGRDARRYFAPAEGEEEGALPGARTAFEATLSDGRARRVLQAAIWTVTGDVVPVAFGVAPIGAQLPEEGAVLLFADLRDRIALEAKLAATQRLEALGQVTGGVAHDFNNLLTVVAGNAEMIAAADVPEHVRRAASLVRSAADRGASTTRRLLAFASRQSVAPESVAIARAVQEAVPMLASSIGRDYALHVDAGDLEATVRVERVGLDAAILNLVLNARDAMPGGGPIEIVLREERVDAHGPAPLAAGSYVRVEVRDRGTGVPLALRERVFEPFFTTKPTGKGTGLGLSTVHGFVRRAGGHVDVTDRPEASGAVVRLWLPIDPGGRTAQVEPPGASPGVPTEGLHAVERVLVIEDDDGVRAYLTAVLEGLGHVVVSEPDGARGLARLRADDDVTMLLTDVVMPGEIDGLAVAKIVRRERPRIGIVVATGYAPSLEREPGGADGFVLLAKPFDRADLRSAMQRARAALAG